MQRCHIVHKQMTFPRKIYWRLRGFWQGRACSLQGGKERERKKSWQRPDLVRKMKDGHTGGGAAPRVPGPWPRARAGETLSGTGSVPPEPAVVDAPPASDEFPRKSRPLSRAESLAGARPPAAAPTATHPQDRLAHDHAGKSPILFMRAVAP